MGMTIDKAMYLIEHHKPNDVNNAYELWEAFCVAIDTMRKYQKIEQIFNNAKDSDGAVKYNWLYEQIGEVLEDGND